MRAETVLRVEAINLLIETFGVLETERFISSIKSNNFDCSAKGTYPALQGVKKGMYPETDTLPKQHTSSLQDEVVDYTEWQKYLWKDKGIEEIHKLATEFESKKKGHASSRLANQR